MRGTVPARFVHSNRKTLFFTSPDFLPILIPGTYLRTQRATQQGLHDASLHSSQPYDERLHPGWETEKRCASHSPPQILYLFGAACINQDTVVNYKLTGIYVTNHRFVDNIRTTDNMSVRVCPEIQAHGYLLDKPQVRR